MLEAFVRDISLFLQGSVDNLAALVTGGVVGLGIAIYQSRTNKNISWPLFRRVAAVLLMWTFFSIWREEHAHVVDLQSRIIGLQSQITGLQKQRRAAFELTCVAEPFGVQSQPSKSIQYLAIRNISSVKPTECKASIVPSVVNAKTNEELIQLGAVSAQPQTVGCGNSELTRVGLGDLLYASSEQVARFAEKYRGVGLRAPAFSIVIHYTDEDGESQKFTPPTGGIECEPGQLYFSALQSQ